MKKILFFFAACCLCTFTGNKAFAGCAPGEAYVEILMNSDNYVDLETSVIITIGGVIVFDSGLLGGLPPNNTTGVILNGCFPEGDIIDITYVDAYGDGILVDPPFFIQNGCEFVGATFIQALTASVYNAPVNTDADATTAAGNPNGTAAAGCPDGPTTSAMFGTVALSPTLPDDLTPPSFPAGVTSYPVCDAASGDDTGNALSGTSTQDFTENFVVCADWTQPNATGNETGAYIGTNAVPLEYAVVGFNDADVGTAGPNDCGIGFAAIDIFESGTCTAVSSGTTILTELTPGTTYTVCVEFFVSDFGAGADGQFGTADDEPTADGSCTLQEIVIGVEPFDFVAVCETYNAISLAAGCGVFDLCIGYTDVDQDGLSDVDGSDPTGTTMTVDFSAATGGTFVNDGIFAFDADGDGVVDATGYCVTYTFDVQGCDPIPYSGLVTLMCPDGTEGTLDVGTGTIALTAADVIGDVFGVVGGGAFYPALTATTTAAVCPLMPDNSDAVAGSVAVTSPDGTVCTTIAGDTPACDTSGGNAAEVVQLNPIADPLLSAIFGAGSFACTIDETADLSFACGACQAPACMVDITAPASATGCDLNDGAGFPAPLDLAACMGADGPVGTGQVFDIYLYTPAGGAATMAPAGYEAMPIPVDAEFPDPFQDGNLSAIAVDLTCADAIGNLGLLNPTCDQAVFTFIYFPFDYTLDNNGNGTADYPTDCTPVRVDYTVNPTLTPTIDSDDSGTCGDVMASLSDAGGNMCPGTEMTVSCDPATSTYPDITLTDNGCGPYVLTGAACAGCVVLECSITPDAATNIACDDAGTPGDPLDDTYTFDILVNGSNTDPAANNTFNDDQGNTGIAYGMTVSYGPFPISGGDITVIFTDTNDGTCTATMMAAAPATCSNAMCSISASTSNFACDDSGTPDDPSDDMVTFTYTVIDNNAGGATSATTWSSNQGDTGVAYGTIINVGPLPADGSTFTINVTDDTAANCMDSTSIVLQSCETIENIPTVGEWGLIMLGLLMSIIAIVGIRQRREEENQAWS